MAVVEVHPETIEGPWVEGFVLDRHVISSRPIGHVGEHMQFETTRSPLGELVYQLKYRNGPLNDIVETAVALVSERWNGLIDCVVPPPPSLHRTKQPAGLAGNSMPLLRCVLTYLRYSTMASADCSSASRPSFRTRQGRQPSGPYSTCSMIPERS